jgi:hypothetical protein
MLYGTDETVPADKFGIYSSVSHDGKTWVPEGIRLAGSFSGPDVVALPEGGYRMYLNGVRTLTDNTGVTHYTAGVLSYTSSDGATWQPEEGTRLPEAWLDQGERYGFTSTTRLANGMWLMAYAVERDGRYRRNVPSGLASIRWATSSDGLTFTKRGTAVNPNNEVLLGGARSPEFFGNQLYFHSLKGIYRVAWTGKGFSTRPVVALSACKDPKKVFPWTPPPADPTLARIGSSTVMFHGDFTRGIFRNVLNPKAKSCFRGIFVPPPGHTQ